MIESNSDRLACADQEGGPRSMSMAQIKVRLDELTLAARMRMPGVEERFPTTLGFAEIDYMTPAERKERHELMLQMPTFAEEREAARARIQARIRERRKEKSFK